MGGGDAAYRGREQRGGVGVVERLYRATRLAIARVSGGEGWQQRRCSG